MSIYITVDTEIADKNDGVVNIHSALWSKGDALESTHNQYNSDVSHDGGYNHFELRNYARAYDLPANGSEPGFNKGDENPAMGRVEDWIKDGFGNIGN